MNCMIELDLARIFRAEPQRPEFRVIAGKRVDVRGNYGCSGFDFQIGVANNALAIADGAKPIRRVIRMAVDAMRSECLPGLMNRAIVTDGA
jgi:hypothetical protein